MSLSREELLQGWAHQVANLDTDTAEQLERLVALPIEARRGAALNEQLQPTTLLIVSLISVATAVRQDEPDEGHSLADAALLLISRHSLAGEDSRRLVDALIDYWLEVFENALLDDDLARSSHRIRYETPPYWFIGPVDARNPFALGRSRTRSTARSRTDG